MKILPQVFKKVNPKVKSPKLSLGRMLISLTWALRL